MYLEPDLQEHSWLALHTTWTVWTKLKRKMCLVPSLARKSRRDVGLSGTDLTGTNMTEMLNLLEPCRN